MGGGEDNERETEAQSVRDKREPQPAAWVHIDVRVFKSLYPLLRGKAPWFWLGKRRESFGIVAPIDG